MANQGEILKSKIQDFLSKNVAQDFQFTDENVNKISEIDGLIHVFYQDPFRFIDPGLSLSAEMMEIKIAEIQAQIEDYREFMKWQNPEENIVAIKLTLKKLKKDLADLEEIKWQEGILKSISKATKQTFSGDLDAEKQFILEEIKFQETALSYYQIENNVLKNPKLYTNPNIDVQDIDVQETSETGVELTSLTPKRYREFDELYQKALNKFFPHASNNTVPKFVTPTPPDNFSMSIKDRINKYLNTQKNSRSQTITTNQNASDISSKQGEFQELPTIYSSPVNAIKSVTYSFPTSTPVGGSEIFKMTKFSKGGAYRLTTANSATEIEYTNGAKLIMNPDGSIGLPPIPNQKESGQNPQPDPSFSEDEFVNHIIYQFQQSTAPNKCINLDSLQLYDTKNPDAARARILSKLVHRYCINENGEVDEKKYNEIRKGILLGNSLRQWREIFLKPELYFLRGPKNISPKYWLNLMGLKAIKRSGGHPEYLHSKQAQKRASIKKFIGQEAPSKQKPSDLTQSSPVTSKFIKDKLQELKAAQQKKGLFPTSWVPTFKTSVTKKTQFEKALQEVITASAEDYNDVITKKPENTKPGQQKLQEAIKTIQKILKVEDKDLKIFLDGKRQGRLDEKYNSPKC